MKKSLCAIVGMMVVASSAVHAESSSYAGATLGQSKYADIPEFGSVEKTAVSLFYGMPLSEQFDAEFGYINHGSAQKTISLAGTAYTAKLRTQSVYAAAVGKLPISGGLSVYGKLGASVNYSEASDSEGNSESKTKVGPMVGLGLSYQFTKEFSGVIDYSYFDKPSDGRFTLQAWSIGARYHF